MKFLGIDLGWHSGASGLCCLQWQNNHLVLVELNRQDSVADILAWVDAIAPAPQPAIIAVDAPTRIANLTGMRLADKLTHQHFGRYHAGCYPANLSRPFAQKTVSFGLSLEARGFLHAPTLASYKLENSPPGRYQIEVFPHPATINLFNLNRILKYKKGKLAERRAELIKLRHYIQKVLPTLEPALSVESLPEIPQTGIALKAIEDKLDSLICAYVAAYWWYWGTTQNLVLGEPTEGYIIVPLPPQRLDTQFSEKTTETPTHK
ncbi:MAG: DUF429 domain-containing protein [Desertifilum sp.]|nr:DUF429 domain-containing protein [Desertifilum sp.]MDI9635231.1 DUF429 domain-containing protein [Geitlerinema splendidum]